MDENMEIVFCFDRTKILQSLSVRARKLICDHEISIRYLSEEEKENHPDAKYALDMDFYNHWTFFWNGRVSSLQRALNYAMSW